jgi:hypothetical protein
LKYFVLPDIDNWNGYMGSSSDGRDLFNIKRSLHKDMEINNAYFEKVREEEIKIRNSKNSAFQRVVKEVKQENSGRHSPFDSISTNSGSHKVSPVKQKIGNN